jgi:hypothetical protein
MTRLLVLLSAFGLIPPKQHANPGGHYVLPGGCNCIMVQAVWVYTNNEMINLAFSWYRSYLMFYGQIVGFIFNFWSVCLQQHDNPASNSSLPTGREPQCPASIYSFIITMKLQTRTAPGTDLWSGFRARTLDLLGIVGMF